MWADGTTMEISIDISQKKIEETKYYCIYILRILTKTLKTSMFTATLFTTAKKQDQPRYPSIEKWLKKVC